MAYPKYMLSKLKGTVVSFDEDLFKTEKYVPYDPAAQAKPAEKTAKAEKPAKAPSAQD